MPNKKTKQVGKIVVVILSVAIFFFLLLPFLESDSETAKEGTAKKATPQIFTSNPLSELARKIYAMFSGKSRSKAPNIPPQQTNILEEGENMLALAPAEAERYSAEHESDSQVSTVGVTYDEYGEAGFVNEEGEWVLIRQTAPETAERGMHEVSTTDKAYDKYVQLERSAKYIGKSSESAAAIPESKWARLWRPIKKLFSKDEETPSADPTNTDKPFALAAASTGLGQDKNISTRQERKSGKNPFSSFSRRQWGNAISIDQFTDPATVLNESAEQLKEMARNMLDSKRADEVIEKIEQNKQKAIEQANQQIKEQKQDELEQAIEQNQQNGVQFEPGQIVTKLYTFASDCRSDDPPSAKAVGFPHNNPPLEASPSLSSCNEKPIEYNDPEYIEAQKQELSQKLLEAMGTQAEKPTTIETPPVVVVVDKLAAGQPLDFKQLIPPGQDSIPQDSPYWSQVEYLKLLYQAKGCDKHDCYAISNTLTNVSHDVPEMGAVAGLDIYPGLSGDEFENLKADLLANLPYDNEQMIPVISRLQQEFPTVTFVDEETFNQIKQGHIRLYSTAELAKISEKPEDDPNYFVDKDKKIFNGDLENGNREKGASAQEQYIKSKKTEADITKEANQKFKNESTEVVLEQVADKEADNIKKNGDVPLFDFHVN
ncbi:MAG: hypothetical protein IKN49_03285 [Elusimicrobiaceae bacterium]|nr:hypothetical protein [Elusimicrobiaceae bacterium]